MASSPRQDALNAAMAVVQVGLGRMSKGAIVVEDPIFPNSTSVPVLWDSSVEDPTPHGRSLNFLDPERPVMDSDGF